MCTPASRRSLRSLPAGLLCLLLPALPLPAPDATPVTFTVTPDADPHPVNPLTFGENNLDLPETTWQRHGGNRATGYNWETNASHAGTDWKNNNDFIMLDWAKLTPEQGKQPAAATLEAVRRDREAHKLTMLTLQLAGYVSADGNGPVAENETAPSPRFNKVVVDKGKPLAATPDLTDDTVYLDEQVHFLIGKLGTAKQKGVALYSLDNEPGLWASTHPRIHKDKATGKEVADQGIAAATMVLKQDPDAQIFGPVAYGWMEYLNLQDAPDAKEINKTFGNYTGYYLDRFKKASDAAGKRLLHYYDFHWYSEARGDKRITEHGTSQKDCDARMQAPRSLWDPTYKENSWILQTTGGEAIALIPRFQKCVDQYDPGTKLSFSEYNFGGGMHISGGIAQADALGIFRQYGCAAAFWALGNDTKYVAAAFRLFLNYDGHGGTLGDMVVKAASADAAAGSVYAGRDAKTPATLKVLVLNKQYDRTLAATVKLAAPNHNYKRVIAAWRLDGDHDAKIVALTPVPPVKNNEIALDLPPMSATVLVVE